MFQLLKKWKIIPITLFSWGICYLDVAIVQLQYKVNVLLFQLIFQLNEKLEIFSFDWRDICKLQRMSDSNCWTILNKKESCVKISNKTKALNNKS